MVNNINIFGHSFSVFSLANRRLIKICEVQHNLSVYSFQVCIHEIMQNFDSDYDMGVFTWIPTSQVKISQKGSS